MHLQRYQASKNIQKWHSEKNHCFCLLSLLRGTPRKKKQTTQAHLERFFCRRRRLVHVARRNENRSCRSATIISIKKYV